MRDDYVGNKFSRGRNGRNRLEVYGKLPRRNNPSRRSQLGQKKIRGRKSKENEKGKERKRKGKGKERTG
ncbi:hypothetical protein RUM43_002514 [Polyplax serrata]|uniref:Uncharacterized protein n=1 Tax=Polyplax serrata TaxID=468196 RepID=A0AAN8NYX8_POLSC